MTFSNIFKKSFLEGFVHSQLTIKSIVAVLGITCLFSIFMFIVYRVLTRKTFYDKTFNIAVAVIPLIVSSIIITIQSSIVISLGMVGALSIVRFRTAIKNPMDLVFLFWSISIGIICGAGLPGIALVMSVAIAVGVIVYELVPVAKAPKLLVINAQAASLLGDILDIIKQDTSVFSVKSQAIEDQRLDLIIELRTKDDNALVERISGLEGVTRCALLSHDGEVTF